MSSEHFQPVADGQPVDKQRSTVGTTHDDALSLQAGSETCWTCKRRRSPADILACERRGPGRVGCGEVER